MVGAKPPRLVLTLAAVGHALVIVESPAKARKIGEYLGDDYVVESSIGHIRDLPRNADDVPKAYKGEPWARTGIDVNLKLDSNLGRLPEAIELSIFRIVQEQLSNIHRHAQASQVMVL